MNRSTSKNSPAPAYGGMLDSGRGIGRAEVSIGCLMVAVRGAVVGGTRGMYWESGVLRLNIQTRGYTMDRGPRLRLLIFYKTLLKVSRIIYLPLHKI